MHIPVHKAPEVNNSVSLWAKRLKVIYFLFWKYMLILQFKILIFLYQSINKKTEDTTLH
jgi:hypothetical protein